MSQTSLNLVAITLFSLVMISVWSPVLGISPTIPALMVFSLLGVATLDRFTWQGKLGTLVVDGVAQFSADHRLRVVRHEAGHFLVAHLLGIPVTSYTLNAWSALRQGQSGMAGVCFNTQDLDSELEQGVLSTQSIDRYCKVWMAGIAAETLIYGNAEGGADDRQKFGILWAQLDRPPAEGEQKQRWAAFQAKMLIQTHQPAFEALVAAMEQRATVEDCQRAIDQAVAQNPSPAPGSKI